MIAASRIASACLAAVVVSGLLAGATGGAAAADHDGSPAFVVELEENGDATVTLVSTYDLRDDDERDAFRALANDTDARSALRDRFESRMASVANDTAAETDREMRVSDGSIDVSNQESSEVGTVALSVRWSGLAALEDDSIVLTEPFASGFESDRTFVVTAPDGYAASGVTPEADSGGAEQEGEPESLRWEPGTSLEGFEVTFEPTSSANGDSDDAAGSGSSQASAPGFGAVTAVLALIGTLLAARARADR
ncbi:PGF-CTERM sorting domain-containing protein [Halopenitus salinus]|uniref:PGF-CTERM sorting domain-containing protein n=1 Tax=Halopenitus salinus TaxID=1198295 RepID=A0ABD5UQ73_9EURY